MENKKSLSNLKACCICQNVNPYFMKKYLFWVLLPFLLQASGAAAQGNIASKVSSMQAFPGYFNYYWDAQAGKIWLEIDKFDQEFLYVNSLTAGVGSNDIGLDRNQLGGEHVVVFERSGPKILLRVKNLKFRAVSDNPEEQQSVEEAFASSIIWGFKVEAEEDNKVLVDFTPFLMRDAHGVVQRLRSSRQGTYRLEESRSAMFMERTKNFPQNSEFEATLTFTGTPEGGWIRSVTPVADVVSVRMHHSLVQLPDNNYQPRVYDPRSGYNDLAYYDYATPISEPLVKRFIVRHRLEKKNPNAAVSEAVEPIVYYLDRGTPEPILSALIEGASWWNQAFEAAGYKDAFQVKLLPPDADPMDVRYNVINWVHRSTRGWSYGSSVTDPRTGEIIKGHVSLGSLRVRQDFLIAQGLIRAYENGEKPDPRLEQLALARLRQLSAHEVGHTIGLAHNFASSVNDRASVMDYPHPFIALDANGKVDFSKAYDTGIAAWDKRTILYGYQDFPDNVNEAAALKGILTENIKMGLHYISDEDARPVHGANPYGHLWDNGASAVGELERMKALRAKGLAGFGEWNIPVGTPMSNLESVLVPLYLMHRYQVEAVSKLIGGVHYTYAARGDGQPLNEMVAPEQQKEALEALLATLDPAFLAVPESVIALIPPQAKGYSRNRELFKIHTGLTFDPIGAAESSAANTLKFLLNPERLTRLVEQYARDPEQRLSLAAYLDKIIQSVEVRPGDAVFHQEIARMTEKLVLQHLLELAGDNGIMRQVTAVARLKVAEMEQRLQTVAASPKDPNQGAHYIYMLDEIARYKADPAAYQVPPSPAMPDGSPIGCDGMF